MEAIATFNFRDREVDPIRVQCKADEKGYRAWRRQGRGSEIERPIAYPSPSEEDQKL